MFDRARGTLSCATVNDDAAGDDNNDNNDKRSEPRY